MEKGTTSRVRLPLARAFPNLGEETHGFRACKQRAPDRKQEPFGIPQSDDSATPTLLESGWQNIVRKRSLED